MTYYSSPHHIEYRDTYHNGWSKAGNDLKINDYIVLRDNFNSRTKSKPLSLAAYYYDKGYFDRLCQHASDNKLI